MNHWGWGAVMVDTPPPEWVCPHCTQGKGRTKQWKHGRHIYLFGPPRCTPCAEAWFNVHSRVPGVARHPFDFPTAH